MVLLTYEKEVNRMEIAICLACTYVAYLLHRTIVRPLLVALNVL